MIYLASPYSHLDPAVREQRFHDACRAMVSLLRQGHVVFSPVVLSHPLVAHGMGTGWRDWEASDREFLRQSDEVVVLMLEGWKDSVGVAAEVQMAMEMGKRVRYLEPDESMLEVRPYSRIDASP